MSSSSLETEELENVPLVRMEDVQPSRDKIPESSSPSNKELDEYETCLIDNMDYVSEYVINGDENDDNDSNIGSMVSLQSGDMYDEGNSSQELIIPDLDGNLKVEERHLKVYVHNEGSSVGSEEYTEDPIDDDGGGIENKFNDVELNVAKSKYMELIINPELNEGSLGSEQDIEDNSELVTQKNKCSKITKDMIKTEAPPTKKKKIDIKVERLSTPPEDQWPTLEILPGGVIKNTDKFNSDSSSDKGSENTKNDGEMMYACAKCSQTFKYLFCLVKHVKWHEDQKKNKEYSHLEKLSATEQELISLKRERLELDQLYKEKKLQVLKRIAVAVEKLKYIPNILIALLCNLIE